MENQASQPTGVKPGETKILRPLEAASGSGSGVKSVLLPALIILAIILFGSFTGYFLANRGPAGSSGGTKVVGGEKAVSSSDEMGLKDEKAFPDKAQGKLEVNESETVAEGSHRLIRPGGPSQAAYLTSSAVDLNQFLGKCVEVWGETFAAQKAGWLLDVGFVKRLDKCPEGL